MGLWSAALMGGGGLGAAFTPWLASRSTVWHQALAWWALPPCWPCSAGWRFAGNCLAHRIRPALPRVAIIGQRRAWTLGLYF
jgi:CP family cyanate transporter-like MFS transporter